MPKPIIVNLCFASACSNFYAVADSSLLIEFSILNHWSLQYSHFSVEKKIGSRIIASFMKTFQFTNIEVKKFEQSKWNGDYRLPNKNIRTTSHWA